MEVIWIGGSSIESPLKVVCFFFQLGLIGHILWALANSWSSFAIVQIMLEGYQTHTSSTWICTMLPTPRHVEALLRGSSRRAGTWFLPFRRIVTLSKNPVLKEYKSYSGLITWLVISFNSIFLVGNIQYFVWLTLFEEDPKYGQLSFIRYWRSCQKNNIIIIIIYI